MGSSERLRDAINCHQSGNAQAAAALYLEILRADPSNFDALQLLAVLCASLGRDAIARALFERALEQNPTHVATNHNRGNLHARAGRYSDAIDDYKAALKSDPQYVQARLSLGVVLSKVGRYEEAEVELRRVLAEKSEYPEISLALEMTHQPRSEFHEVFHCAPMLARQDAQVASALNELGVIYIALDRIADATLILELVVLQYPAELNPKVNLGVAYFEAGRLQDAKRVLEDALARSGPRADIYINLGNLCVVEEGFQPSLRYFETALRLDPNNVAALSSKANVLIKLNLPGMALPVLKYAASLSPKDGAILNNLAATYLALDDFSSALNAVDQALCSNVHSADPYLTRGSILLASGEPMRAIVDFERATKIGKPRADIYNNMGNAYLSLNRVEDALAAYSEALRIDDHHPDAHFNRGLCYLLQGRLKEGWTEYEWRRKESVGHMALPNEEVALLQRLDQLDGKTVLVRCEQGLGDSIQFCRYVSDLKANGADVVLAVQAPLLRLISANFRAVSVKEVSATVDNADYYCPMLSLPKVLGLDSTNIVGSPYLTVPEDARNFWEGKIQPSKSPRVGLVWSGSTGHKNDKSRSIPFSEFSNILAPGAAYFCLQRDIREADAALLSEHPEIQAFGIQLEDFAITAALVEKMDLVITVDTSVAHLAGALGKRVWILLPFSPDWRWMTDRSDTPWYDSARLFRQSELHSWDAAIAGIEAELKTFLANDPSLSEVDFPGLLP